MIELCIYLFTTRQDHPRKTVNMIACITDASPTPLSVSVLTSNESDAERVSWVAEQAGRGGSCLGLTGRKLACAHPKNPRLVKDYPHWCRTIASSPTDSIDQGENIRPFITPDYVLLTKGRGLQFVFGDQSTSKALHFVLQKNKKSFEKRSYRKILVTLQKNWN